MPSNFREDCYEVKMSGDPVLKSGWLQKYSKGFMSDSWKFVFVRLYKDANFCWFRNDKDMELKGCVNLREVCNFLALGAYARAIPHCPDTPAGSGIDHMIAFPEKPKKKSKVYFFSCGSDDNMASWQQTILSTLPQVPSSTAVQTAPPGGMQAYAASPPSVPSSTAPSYAPGGLPTAQPPPLGFDMTATAGNPPPYSPYPTSSQPYPATVPPAQGLPPYAQQPYPQQPYPQQPYPQQPQQQSYPQQPYPQQSYPRQPQQQSYPQQPYQQQSYPQQPPHQQPYQQVAYPQQPYQQQSTAGYQQPTYVQQPHTVVVPQQKKKGGKGYGKMAAGLAGGALAGYAAHKVLGGFGGGMFGHGGGWGGSWSSGSWSCGSGGSFGSFGGCD
ncbi:hypothetical protein LSAT2_016577 [Lamellibrachia satsuma]|nr:hypothetical protein LSAT2_016577 [Lamellibrachia satsuma]